MNRSWRAGAAFAVYSAVGAGEPMHGGTAEAKRRRVWRRIERAFTLAEMLVVLAIVGLLVAVMLPAVQAARETARRAQCMNHLHQLAVAAHHANTAHGRLPPGGLGATSPTAFYQTEAAEYLGVLPFLLPFLEQATLFDAIQTNRDPRKNSQQVWHHDPATWEAAQQTVAVFLCPSAEAWRASEGIVVVTSLWYDDQQAHMGRGVFYYDKHPQAAALGRTHYAAVAGVMGHLHVKGYERWQGIFINRTRLRLADVANHDGTSNTLLFGEAAGWRGGRPYVRVEYAWMGLGGFPTRWLPSDDGADLFRSTHEGVINFAFADGAVRSLDADIDADTFYALSGWRDGQPVSGTDF